MTLTCNGHQDVTNSNPGNGIKMSGPFDIEGMNIQWDSITTQRLQIELWLLPLLIHKTEAVKQNN